MDPSTESDEDEQLRLAIALSLQDEAKQRDGGSGSEEKTFLDLLDDDEPTPLATATTGSESQTQTNQAEAKQSLGILGLDRKKMEEERLARNRKRKASISPLPIISATKASRTVKPSETTRNKHQDPLTNEESSIKSLPHASSAIQYPNGVVKKTWSPGFPSDNDIRLEDVLQRATLQLAVLSSFQWEIDWLFKKMDMSRSKVVLVMEAKDEATKEQYRRETVLDKNLRLCFPSMKGNVNCMHSKLMLLSHSTHLRIAIPTGNLTVYDWGESGIIENSVFIIDLPRLPDGSTSQKEEELTFFGQELLYYCRRMDLDPSIVRSLLKFDFSATKPYAFVHSIGGEHMGTDEPWRRTGYPGLGNAVQRLGLTTSKGIDVDYISSSIGSLNHGFLSTLYLAAQGDDGTTEYNWRTRPKPRGKKADPIGDSPQQTAMKQSVEDNFRLFFPSRETVITSNGGVDAAGPICFYRKWWEGPKFPRSVLRDCKSTRQGLLMHNKILYVRPQQDSGPVREATPDSQASTVDVDVSSESRPWAYIGSANCSESAWGRLTLDRTTKTLKLGCRNWECGVLIPVANQQTEDDSRSDQGLDSFKDTVPAPIEWPGDKMEGKTPWYFTEGNGA